MFSFKETHTGDICLSSERVHISSGMEVQFRRDGCRFRLVPHFLPHTYVPYSDSVDGASRLMESSYRDMGLALWRQIAIDPDEPGRVRLRLCVRNESDGDVWLDRMTLLHIEKPEDLFPGTDSRDWILFRQGRMKNDLPAVCRLGDFGPAFLDMVGEMDESGGYRPGRQDAERIVSDNVTVLRSGTENAAGVLLGFMTGEDQLFETVIDLDESHRCSGITCNSVYEAVLPKGREAASEWLRIDVDEDSFAALSRYAADRSAGGSARAGSAPAVFCTWYYYGLSVTQDDVLSDLSKLRQRGIPFDVFQLDEGWEITLGDWRVNGKFSMTLPEIARTIEGYGFIPGIWTSPFIAHETAPAATEHPEWFLRNTDGDFCLFPMNDTVYRVLDITNPEVIEWIEQLYRMLAACGFRYHKLDFTRAPVIAEDAVFYDPTVPRARAYRNAVQAVRRGIGEDAYLLICGGLYDAVIGLADGQRTGSDVLGMWNDPENPARTTVPFTVKQTILRGFMNAWWNNDPDALMVRRQRTPSRGLALSCGLLDDAEVRTTALSQYLGGGLVCSTEPMDKIEDDRLMVLRHLLPPLAVRTTARDMFSGNRYPSILDTEVRDGAWHTVSIINWGESPWRPDLVLSDALVGGLAEGKTYRVCEFFSGMITEGLKPGDPVPVPAIPRHGAIHLKIEAEDPDLPSVVASTAHFSFGGELSRLEMDHGTLIFDTYVTVNAPVRYTIQLPKGMHCAALPSSCAVFNGRLEIYLPKPGNWCMEVPLRQDDEI